MPRERPKIVVFIVRVSGLRHEQAGGHGGPWNRMYVLICCDVLLRFQNYW